MVSNSWLKKLAFAAAGLLLSMHLHAASVSWVLNNASYDLLVDQATGLSNPLNAADQLTIGGSFSYDVANLDEVNANVTFSVFAFIIKDAMNNTLYQFDNNGFDAYYTPDPITPFPALTLLSKDVNNNDALILEFNNGLNNGSKALLTYALLSIGSGASLVQYESSGVGGASSSVSTVPLPTAAWLFASALFGIVSVRRKAK